MSMTTANNLQRPGWDKRAWRLAAILCGVLGVLTLIGVVGPDSAHPDGGVSSSLLAFSCLFAIFLFPPILSGVAQRRTLLWAYLPLVAWLAWIVGAVIIDGIAGWIDEGPGSSGFDGGAANAVLILVGVLLGGPLITAGPVCIIRYALKRARLRKQAQAVVMEQAIHAPREGVWPPPPSDYGAGQ